MATKKWVAANRIERRSPGGVTSSHKAEPENYRHDNVEMTVSRQYVFGEFRLDARQRALFRQSELIALTPKSLEVLLFLVERHGQIIDKKELLEAVWPETFVEEVSRRRSLRLASGRNGR